MTSRIPLTPVARMEGMCLAHHLFGPKRVCASAAVTNRIPLTPVARMQGMCLAHHLFGPE